MTRKDAFSSESLRQGSDAVIAHILFTARLRHCVLDSFDRRIAMRKSLKILACGLMKSSAEKESDSQEILANKKPHGKDTKTLVPERVQRPSLYEVNPAADNDPPETDLPRPPTDTGEQNASTSLLPRGPTALPGNMSLPSSRNGTSHSKHKDLWDEAYTKLRSEYPNLFKK